MQPSGQLRIVGRAKEYPDRRFAPSGHRLRDVPAAAPDGGHASAFAKASAGKPLCPPYARAHYAQRNGGAIMSPPSVQSLFWPRERPDCRLARPLRSII